MRDTPPTLTYFATAYNSQGQPSAASAITLPYITAIADDPHYTAPPPEPEPERLAIERPPRWSEKLIRRTLGRDRKQTARMLNRIGYEATMRRIDRGPTSARTRIADPLNATVR